MSTSDGPVGEFLDEIEPTIFAFGAGITLLFVAAFAVSPDAAYNVVDGIRVWILAHFNWFFLFVMLGFVLFLGFLIFGPWGRLNWATRTPSTVTSRTSR